MEMPDHEQCWVLQNEMKEKMLTKPVGFDRDKHFSIQILQFITNNQT